MWGSYSSAEIHCIQIHADQNRYIYHHHHIALVARISLTLSRHSSLSFIALGRSSGQQPVSSHSCWMYVRAGHPAFARPCVGIHKSTSLMSWSLLLQQCPACLVRLTWIVFVIGGRYPLTDCCVVLQLFNVARHMKCFKLRLKPWRPSYLDILYVYICVYVCVCMYLVTPPYKKDTIQPQYYYWSLQPWSLSRCWIDSFSFS